MIAEQPVIVEYHRKAARSPAPTTAVMSAKSNNQKPKHNLSKEEVAEIEEAFNMFDLDKDGCITATELRTVMSKLRQDVTTAEVEDMIQKADTDGNGTIEFSEFLQMMGEKLETKALISEDARQKIEEAEAHQAFSVFDIDGDGLIDFEEVRLTMRNLGEDLSDEDVRAMIHAADKNGDGKIDFQEFLSVMRRK